MKIRTGSKHLLLLGLFVLVAIIAIAPEITTMTASAQSTRMFHCTARNPCIQICGDHVCAPGEMTQMLTNSTQTSTGNATTSTTNGTATLTPSNREIIAGKISYVDQASDGSMVLVRTSHPIAGQALTIALAFKDPTDNFVHHQNYAITVAQDSKVVLSNPLGHTHTGVDSLITDPLLSNDPVAIQVTLNGIGLPSTDPSTWTGVKGEVLNFTNVVDVQAPASMSGNMTMTGNQTTSGNMTANGNQTVPEFGPVASIVLAIAVLSIIVFAAKTKTIPRF